MQWQFWMHYKYPLYCLIWCWVHFLLSLHFYLAPCSWGHRSLSRSMEESSSGKESGEGAHVCVCVCLVGDPDSGKLTAEQIRITPHQPCARIEVMKRSKALLIELHPWQSVLSVYVCSPLFTLPAGSGRHFCLRSLGFLHSLRVKGDWPQLSHVSWALPGEWCSAWLYCFRWWACTYLVSSPWRYWSQKSVHPWRPGGWKYSQGG